MPMDNRIIPSIFACLLCACSEPPISKQIADRFDSGASESDLASVGPDGWERVCVLGPYTNNEQAEEILGFNGVQKAFDPLDAALPGKAN
jgi:hypothetical protein